MAESSTSAPEKSQYHHYIPRFILRNYSHPSQPPSGPGKSKKRGKRKNGPRSTEPMVYGINLAGEEVEITETSVAKTFGMMDMYRDLGKSKKQHQVEEQLSVLEARAGEIISTIRKAFEAGKSDVWITRTQRDTLRKFLFIMKYRGCRFHKRYYHDDAGTYDEDDKERMLKYMTEKGIKKPIDVWFDNIKGILELNMDYGMEWMDKLQKRIYPDDAKWFINNTQQFYLALCTPSAADDEFLLTQNAYGVYEGATTEIRDPLSGEVTPGPYTEFHVFAPIAPRLIIVLRTFILPVPLEDSDDAMREQRKIWYQANISQHAYPERAGSVLRDLPIDKALNSYSKVVDGRVVPINGGPTGPSDKFCFRFFSISQDYVHKINGIMLNESYQIDMIVINNKASACRILKHYLDHFGELGVDIDRIRNLKKLQHAAELLSAALPKQETPNTLQSKIRGLKLSEDKVLALFDQNKKAKELYFELSGNTVFDTKDFDQARGLLYMRIKLDSNTRGLTDKKREEARNDFLKMYDKFPVQVVWIYLKRIRFMKHGGTMIGTGSVLEDYDLPAKLLDGLEDVVASCLCPFLSQLAVAFVMSSDQGVARNLFRKRDFCRVMHHASFNGALIAKPSWGLIGELTLDDDGLRRLQEEKELVLGTQGSICDCGIPELEELAKAMQKIVHTDSLHKIDKRPYDCIFSEVERIELATRLLVRGNQNESTVRSIIQNQELEKVIFEVVYPLFGGRQARKV